MNKKDPPGQKSAAELRAEQTERIRRACASEATYDRLKELAFDEAARIRRQDPRALDALAEAAVVRMEQPVAKSRDEELNVTVCTGRFILELPPGAENAFDGERRLTAEIEYAAQAAADGSGLVYHMEGAEPIIYRLATVGGLPRPTIAATGPGPSATPPPTQPAPQVAEAAPTPPKAAPAPPRTSASPSFNCAQGRSRSERMVCSSPDLAERDRRMSSIYYSALAESDGSTRRRLRASRDRFLRYRERCPNAACIAQAYEDRIHEIRDIAAGR
ncbi:MAG TPA: hypothetical protein VFO69_01785 [Allosphingosinicella sp.]|nr:hypothetical protein [Allosphingosinicella sp.]